MEEEEMLKIMRNFSKNIIELSNEGKKLFYAIMNIADERDELKNRINKAIEYMNKWGIEPDYDMSREMQEYSEFQEILKILKGEE